MYNLVYRYFLPYSVLVIYWIQFGGNCYILIVLDNRQTYTRYVTVITIALIKGTFYLFVKVLLFLWSNTVRPYLNILGEWITNGILRDSYAETCVKMLVVNATNLKTGNLIFRVLNML